MLISPCLQLVFMNPTEVNSFLLLLSNVRAIRSVEVSLFSFFSPPTYVPTFYFCSFPTFLLPSKVVMSSYCTISENVQTCLHVASPRWRVGTREGQPKRLPTSGSCAAGSCRRLTAEVPALAHRNL